MKKITLIICSIMTMMKASAQGEEQQKLTKMDKNGMTYEYAQHDPLNARIYTLDNGLTVYLSPYIESPRIQTYVAVKAGSKMDPADATGLAHYLEHIMFKGTSKIGTADWEKEKVLLNEIEQLYEVHRKTTDSEERTKIYHKIDSISGVAAKLAIANEYDKLVSSIGATGTNAYTSFEQTVYVNDIPANALEKWAKIEAERFSEVVPRLFHTELEAVYEEKNMGLDNDRRKVWENLLAGVFEKHQYGTQTTIGTVEHLKSPSITEIKKYFDKYYVPNNIAICLSGDFDPEEAILILKKHFGNWKSKSVEAFKVTQETPIEKPKEIVVYGPDAENILIAFRLPGVRSKDALKMEMVSMILANSQAGLIDLNLNQKQKVMGAYSYAMPLKDYSMHILAAGPKTGQSLDEVKKLLLSQLDLIKEGNFPDWLIPAIINDFKVSQLKEYESNKNRADAFVSAFIYNMPWAEYTNKIDELKKITKQEIVQFVNSNYADNYVVVKKLTGTDSSIVKVPKPNITPVSVNRDAQSEFYKEVMKMPNGSLTPLFIDFEKDITKDKLNSGVQVLYNQNKENDLFELYYYFDFDKDDDLKMALAIQYLNYIGSKKLSAEALQQEFYKLGCTFHVQANADQVYVQLTGLQENFIKATLLLEEFLENPKADKEALNDMVQRILKSRSDAKLSKESILRKGMLNYAQFGKENTFRHNLTEEELKKISPKELTDLAKSLLKYRHKVLYYGPSDAADIVEFLNKEHKTTKKGVIDHINNEFKEEAFPKNKILFAHYDMLQAEIMFVSKSGVFDSKLFTPTTLYNEYFGGGMGSIVFQDLRESKALAYSTYSVYKMADKKDKANFNISFIGTQADKSETAITEMLHLLDSIPYSEVLFLNAQDAIKQKLETQRILRSKILFEYLKAQKRGISIDPRKTVYDEISNLTFDSIKSFQEKHIKDQPYTLLIMGSKENLDFEKLKKFGEVTELSLEEIFGY